MSLRVELLDTRASRTADRFVLAHPGGTPFHESRWLDLVRSTFRFETQTLVAWRGREVAGVLPLALVAAPVTGRRLVSVPFGVYGGILASDEESVHALDEASMLLSRTSNARFLETRYIGEGPTHHQSLAMYDTYRKELPGDPAEVLGTIPRKARAEVRKGRDRHGLVMSGGSELFDEFYRLYLINKRSLGSPVFAAGYFHRLLDLFGTRAMLHGVMHEGRLIAAVLSLQDRGVLYPYYSGAEAGIDRMGANNFMYAMLMEEAVRRGCTVFDFGRSRSNSGPAAFKRHMGFAATPLDYQYYFPRGGRPPSLNPGNPKMQLPRRLISAMPLWLGRVVGPAIMRHVP
ncbi:MAG: FemAB family XrtA/PEP-CTERM system-associated protein [Planctomycetota bacterium]|jgi:FemAB-related protein (PEP-CTERM system-associated)